MFQTSPSTSQSLVRNVEQVTRLLSEALTNDTTEAIQARTSIGNYSVLNNTRLYSYVVIKAEHVPYDNMGTTYMFPDEDDDLTNYAGRSAQVMVPNGLLQAIGKCSIM